MTIGQIKERVEQSISCIADSDVKEVLECTWAEINQTSARPTKSKLLDFWYEIQDYIKNDNLFSEALDGPEDEDSD